MFSVLRIGSISFDNFILLRNSLTILRINGRSVMPRSRRKRKMLKDRTISSKVSTIDLTGKSENNFNLSCRCRHKMRRSKSEEVKRESCTASLAPNMFPYTAQQPYFYYPILHNSAGQIVPSAAGIFYSYPVNTGVNPYGYGQYNTQYIHSSVSCRSTESFAFRSDREKELFKSRVWEDVEIDDQRGRPGVFFTVMTYNVLAQDLLEQHTNLYSLHEPQTLQWQKRWRNLFKEIQKISPDILCLQEVQESHLKEYYSQLEMIGYEGLYKKRTGMRVDGCAIYYKPESMTLIEYTTVEYYQPNVKVLNRDNVAVIARFAPHMHPSNEFVVATTHLLYNPRRDDVRLAQTQVLLAEVERISFKAGDGKYAPVILTGDFNTPPNSDVYRFITKGYVKYEHMSKTGKVLVPPDLKITDHCQHLNLLAKREKKEDLSRSDELALIKLHHSDKSIEKIEEINMDNPSMFCTGTLFHHFPFRSVYDHYRGHDREGTTFQDQWLTVDYIFYSAKKQDEEAEDRKLKLIARYRLPTRRELIGLTIPNNYFGSDHFSLVAKFKLEY